MGQGRHGLVDGIRSLAGRPYVLAVDKQADVTCNSEVVHALPSLGSGYSGPFAVESVLLLIRADAADELPVGQASQGRHHLAHLERGQGLEGKQVVLRALVQPAVAGLELLMALAPLGRRLAGQRAGDAVKPAPIKTGEFQGALPGQRVGL